ncbi:DNA repair protein RadA [Metallumcola ferriviriculae]|uniref:DNA repair protein RadA n=1 Tax=Metallumcola ferriviriculae TaxID=3039180 RepID=UPI00345889B3
MAKKKSVFVCQECGYESARWLGKCSCGAWNSFVEEAITKSNPNTERGLVSDGRPVPVTAVKGDTYRRMATGSEELDRVLGGGLVPGSLVLISGDPGIGKSTLLLQVADKVAEKHGNVLYISGEESGEQIKLRADRLAVANDKLLVAAETNVEAIRELVTQYRPSMVIIDSIQTLFATAIISAPGSISQVRECAGHILKFAKTENIPCFISAHVTKQGDIAGPRLLDHMVDVVLYLEGERNFGFRMLRSFKNRFGTTNALGVYEMAEQGMVEITNPSEFLLSDKSEGVSGAVVVASVESSRPILVELQALVIANEMGIPPRRTVVGVNRDRLSLIVAVLQKRAGVAMGPHDIYVSLLGGVSVEETSIDLGIAVGLYSSFRDCPVDSKTVVLGELDLAGRVRPIYNIDRLVHEAEKLGFERCVIPRLNKEKVKSGQMELVGVDTIQEVLRILF